jgi:hypothetical protein
VIDEIPIDRRVTQQSFAYGPTRMATKKTKKFIELWTDNQYGNLTSGAKL